MTVQSPTMVTFERILIPTDFSDLSVRALEYGKVIAKRYNSRILLAHVNLPVNPISPPEATWIEEQDEVWEKLEERLEENGSALRAEGFRAETVSLTGNIHEELQSTVEKHKTDLIVMGTHARSGLNRLLFGSETESLMRQAKCPVMVIGPSAPPAPQPAWQVKSVICATSLDPGEAWIAGYAYILALDHKAGFLLLHVKRAHDKGQGGDWQDFEKTFRESISPRHVDPAHFLCTQVSDDTLENTVLDLAKERDADLIVVGAHSASGIASHLLRGTAPKIIAKAPCPIMVLHQP